MVTLANFMLDHHHDSHSATKTKPSLMDKLNPKKDADGDGKPGCKIPLQLDSGTHTNAF